MRWPIKKASSIATPAAGGSPKIPCSTGPALCLSVENRELGGHIRLQALCKRFGTILLESVRQEFEVFPCFLPRACATNGGPILMVENCVAGLVTNGHKKLAAKSLNRDDLHRLPVKAGGGCGV